MTEHKRIFNESLTGIVGDRGPSVACVAIEGEPFSGIVVTRLPDGRVVDDVQVIRGYFEGLGWIYDASGRLIEVSGTFLGQDHGRNRLYDADGHLRREELVVMGCRVRAIGYDDDGSPNLLYDIRSDHAQLVQLEYSLAQYAGFVLPSIELSLEDAYVWVELHDPLSFRLSPAEQAAAKAAGHLFVSPEVRAQL
jgi:hypothetical protein